MVVGSAEGDNCVTQIDDLSQIAADERDCAKRRQRRAGLNGNVCRTDFRRDLEPALDVAMERIWQLGNLGGGRRDHGKSRLYIQLGKGLPRMTALTWLIDRQ